MKKLSLTALIVSVFAFATTGSAEVVRLHSKQVARDQAAVVPDVFTPVSNTSTTAPALTGREKRAEAAAAAVAPVPAVVDASSLVTNVTTPTLTRRQKRAEAAAAAAVVAPAPAVVDASPLVTNANTPTLTRREKRAEAAVVAPAPAMVDAPSLVTNVTTPKLTGREKRAEAAAAASALADVTPLFLPVTTTTTPEVSSLDASGERTGRRYSKSDTLVDTPDINLNPLPIRAVPEPVSTSLVLIGLFGASMFFIRRYQAGQS